MAHSSSQTNNSGNSINNHLNSNSNNMFNSNIVANKVGQTPQYVILQRNVSQPIDITASTNNGAHVKTSAPTVAQQLAFNKDKKKVNRRFDKNITFSTPIDDPVMDEDFDFEKNLALFDKRAIWDKIDANQKPDLVSIL